MVACWSSKSVFFTRSCGTDCAILNASVIEWLPVFDQTRGEPMRTQRPAELLRLLLILCFSFALSFLMPPLALRASTGVVVATLVLFSFLLGFFVNRALERKQLISRGVSLELLHLRRIYHLCENISDRKLSALVFSHLAKYHHAVGRSFLSHAQTAECFRNVSHQIYAFKPKTRRDEILFSDLLQTVRDLALARKQIEEALANRLSVYSWMVMLTNAGFGVTLLLVNRFEMQYSPLGGAFLISSMLLSVDLLVRTDRISKIEVHAFEDTYRHNVPHQ